MIDHNAPVSAYMRLAAYFTEAITRGDYKPGDKLPSESAMCRQFGVSRTTVRQALQRLSQQDLIYSEHGRGSFVKMPSITSELKQITSFGQVLRQKGLAGKTCVHAYMPIVPGGHPVLGERTAALDLLGYAANAPVVYYRSYFPTELGEKMLRAALDAEKLGTAFSTYDLYDGLQISKARVEQTIRAVNATEELARILQIPAGKALIVLESVYYAPDNTVLEYKTGYYRSDTYSFSVQRNV